MFYLVKTIVEMQIQCKQIGAQVKKLVLDIGNVAQLRRLAEESAEHVILTYHDGTSRNTPKIRHDIVDRQKTYGPTMQYIDALGNSRISIDVRCTW